MEILALLIMIVCLACFVKLLCMIFKVGFYLLFMPLFLVFAIPSLISFVIFPLSIVASVSALVIGFFSALTPLIPVLFILGGIYLLAK